MANDVKEYMKQLQKTAEIKRKRTVLDNYLTGGKGRVPRGSNLPAIPGEAPVLENLPADADYLPNLPPGLKNQDVREIKTLDDLLRVKGIKK